MKETFKILGVILFFGFMIWLNNNETFDQKCSTGLEILLKSTEK